jgi:hypothetical protein
MADLVAANVAEGVENLVSVTANRVTRAISGGM